MTDRLLPRRRFIRAGLGAAGAATIAGRFPALGRQLGGLSVPAASILDLPAAQSPIDHVVVVMMENRSVDHYLGWLATDETFLEAGRRRYGESFGFTADNTQTYFDAAGNAVPTRYWPEEDPTSPYRMCGHPDPDHGWEGGRVQRDKGFIAEGSGNDEYALGFYGPEDIPTYARLARRFTTFDRYHCSLMASTYPNREYLHSAQSGGNKDNYMPIEERGFQWATIWDRLMAAGVSCGHYFIDVPTTLLWGARLMPITAHIEQYFARAATGTLPSVTFVDPGFTTDLQTDDHPNNGDMQAAQRFVFDVFKAFADSPHWQNGVFIVTYDEWGGFFDHVPPPVLPDDRASADDLENFGQAGFRVPTLMASPYAQPGFVDHNLYDHTSILRFLEWRFLGAPAVGTEGAGWWLTERDRYASNIGASLVTTPTPEIAIDPLPQIPIGSSLGCDGVPTTGDDLPVSAAEVHPMQLLRDSGYLEAVGLRT